MKTKIINANNAIHAAAGVLKKGGIIIYPTETCYGMGADATNEKAVKKLISVKGREAEPISVIVSSLSMIKKYAFIGKDAEILIRKFMPGPLTLVVRKKNIDRRLCRQALLPDALSKKTVGFRIPANRFALRLVKRYGKPITATSANISGKPPIYRIDRIKKAFCGRLDMIIDAGSLPKRKPSAVFDAENRKVLRKGRISEKQIMEALGQANQKL